MIYPDSISILAEVNSCAIINPGCKCHSCCRYTSVMINLGLSYDVLQFLFFLLYIYVAMRLGTLLRCVETLHKRPHAVHLFHASCATSATNNETWYIHVSPTYIVQKAQAVHLLLLFNLPPLTSDNETRNIHVTTLYKRCIFASSNWWCVRDTLSSAGRR